MLSLQRTAGETLAQDLLWEKGVLGLDLLGATEGSRSPSSASRNHRSWEPGLQHGGNSPSLPLTTPWLLSLSGFPVTPVLPTGAALGGHLGKGLVRLKLWRDIIKKTPWEIQQKKTFLLAWGIAYIWIIITKLRVTLLMRLLSHNDVLITVLQGLALVITLTLQHRHCLYPKDVEITNERGYKSCQRPQSM